MNTSNWLKEFRISCVVATALAIVASSATAQDNFLLHDDFNDGDVTDASSGGVWILDGPTSGATLDASSGDLVADIPNGNTGIPLLRVDGQPVPVRSEWSFRARMTADFPGFSGVGTRAQNHATLRDGLLRAGTGCCDISTVQMPYDYLGQEMFLQMDAFDSVITASAWRPGEPDSLVQVSRPYNPVNSTPAAGVGSGNLPARVTFHEVWISSSPLGVIPEPSSLTIALLGLVPVIGIYRRRRSSARSALPTLMP